MQGIRCTQLSEQEYVLLKTLMEGGSAGCTSEQLLTAVWGENKPAIGRLHSLLTRLRDKIEPGFGVSAHQYLLADGNGSYRIQHQRTKEEGRFQVRRNDLKPAHSD